MKLTKIKLRNLINESLQMKGKAFIVKNEMLYDSFGWQVVTTNSDLKQLTYDIPQLHGYIVIYQSNPWEINPSFPSSKKDDINTYVLSHYLNGQWGKEIRIDIRNFALIKAISSLFKQAVELMGEELHNIRQGIELLSTSSDDSFIIKAGEILSDLLEPSPL